jgi:hypothetical protein
MGALLALWESIIPHRGIHDTLLQKGWNPYEALKTGMGVDSDIDLSVSRGPARKFRTDRAYWLFPSIQEIYDVSAVEDALKTRGIPSFSFDRDVHLEESIVAYKGFQRNDTGFTKQVTVPSGEQFPLHFFGFAREKVHVFYRSKILILPEPLFHEGIQTLNDSSYSRQLAVAP